VRGWPVQLLALALVAGPAHALAHDASAHMQAGQSERLPMMGAAPDFTLTSQDSKPVSLHDFRGKAVAIAFIYTSCTDVCPMLTANMASVEEKLGPAFGSKVAFISITVDPERDTPEVLKQYAENFGADPKGWVFLTGDVEAVRQVGLKYGVIAKKTADGDVDHNLLTSLVDPEGNLRVQYLGSSFDLQEFRGDLVSLMDEAR
jgi:protein SCO1